MILGSSQEENSLKGLGATTTIRTEGESKTYQAWMLRPEGKNGTRFIFENLPVSCLRYFLKAILVQQIATTPQKTNKKQNKGTTPSPSTHTKTPKQPRTQQKPKHWENFQILSQVCYTLLHGEGWVF